MKYNILTETDILKIFLCYTSDGIRKKIAVNINFTDDEECYLLSPILPNFKKPQQNIMAEIMVCMPNGVFKAQTSLIDVTVNINSIIYKLVLPKNWNFVQLRESTRVKTNFPFVIKYEDGFKINDFTYDVSLGGISFLTNKSINSIYKKLKALISIKVPLDTSNDPSIKNIECTCSFVREKENFAENKVLLVYKLENLTETQITTIKGYLILASQNLY